MLHAMVKALQAQGHEVLVIATVLPEAPPSYTYEGVPVFATNLVYGQQILADWRPDVIVTHHDNTVRAARIARKFKIPFAFLMHNDLAGTPGMLDLGPDLVVFNTEWMRDKFAERAPNNLVVHPPVFAEQHRTVPGYAVTLVNLNRNKGADLFYDLARRMPDQRFLGVVGGHGEQVVRRDLPNVVIQDHTDRMREQVWCRTRVLLMPSVYESYGMAGVEALASGIPVIAHPTPGLLESQGPRGIFVDRDDPDAWEVALRVLSAPGIYERARLSALERSAELDPRPELTAWVAAIERLTP
ncbi:glycosyltransferase family 4 protein [Saccharothrix sp. HUAS TT10]